MLLEKKNMLLESDLTKDSQNKKKINSNNYLHLAEYKNNWLSISTATKETNPNKIFLENFPILYGNFRGRKKKEKFYLEKEHFFHCKPC